MAVSRWTCAWDYEGGWTYDKSVVTGSDIPGICTRAESVTAKERLQGCPILKGDWTGPGAAASTTD